jgi:hypothetical protein
MNTPETQSGGSLEPVGSVPVCERCGMPLTHVRGVSEHDGKRQALGICTRCKCEVWSENLMPPNGAAQARRGKAVEHGTEP